MTTFERTNLEVLPTRNNRSEPTGPAAERQKIAAEGQIMPHKPDIEKAQALPGGTKDLNEVVKSVADFVQNIAREINFSVNETSGEYVVTVTDGGTGEVIRQIPQEEMIQISEHLAEFQRTKTGLSHTGILFESET